jgi:hypothetical protein
VFAKPQRGHLSCSCYGKLGFMGWNVAGSCILTFYVANQYKSKKKEASLWVFEDLMPWRRIWELKTNMKSRTELGFGGSELGFFKGSIGCSPEDQILA